jgi:ABC-type nitrate/sulfonate/bicarbonate transport system ATPase subunit
MAPPSLKISIAEKRFPDSEPLFAGFELSVAPGEIVAVLGRSGVGKSTLLRLIAGIDQKFSGTILIDDVPSHEASAPGFVFQDARLLPWLTVEANIRLAAPDMTQADLHMALDRVGLAGIEAKFPHELSGGMQRRAGLARALASGSGLLLLDEPFVSLDPALASDMRKLLADLVQDGQTTAVLVTHDRLDAGILSDRAVVLGGRPAIIEQEVHFPLPRNARNGATGVDYPPADGFEA